MSKVKDQRYKDELYAAARKILPSLTFQNPAGVADCSLEIARLPEGGAVFRDTKNPDEILVFDAAEWEAFVLGAKDGEFDPENMPR